MIRGFKQEKKEKKEKEKKDKAKQKKDKVEVEEEGKDKKDKKEKGQKKEKEQTSNGKEKKEKEKPKQGDDAGAHFTSSLVSSSLFFAPWKHLPALAETCACLVLFVLVAAPMWRQSKDLVVPNQQETEARAPSRLWTSLPFDCACFGPVTFPC